MTTQPGFSDGAPVDADERVAPHVTATLAAAAMRYGESVDCREQDGWVQDPVPVASATRDLGFQVAGSAAAGDTVLSTHRVGQSPYTNFGTN